MTDKRRRRRSKAPATRIGIAGASIAGFAGLLAAFPVAQASSADTVALDVAGPAGVSAPATPTSARPPRKVVRVIVRRHIVTDRVDGSAPAAAVPSAPASGSGASPAPPSAARPATPRVRPPVRAPSTPQTNGTTHGSR